MKTTYRWKGQKCGHSWNRSNKDEPIQCPVCRDKGAKDFRGIEMVNNAKKIIVLYWHRDKLMPETAEKWRGEFDHNQVFPYSVNKLHEILGRVFQEGLNTMVINKLCSVNAVHVWIDKGRFRQS